VASAGDVNGDGYDDVIVGAMQFDHRRPDTGRAFVYQGTSSGPATTPSWTAGPEQAYTYFGTSVGAAGDVNGDGYDDVIVGAPAYDGGQFDEGRASGFAGSDIGLSTTATWTWESDQDGSVFGSSVGSARDVNGDAFDDLIIGAPGFTDTESAEGGAVLVEGRPF
jgi:hypothetical protein